MRARCRREAIVALDAASADADVRTYSHQYSNIPQAGMQFNTSSTSIFSSRRTDEMSLDTNSSSGSRTSSTKHGRAQYKIIEHAEDLDRYCPGGYHPIQIGDDLDDGQYRLVDKLGYGGYSTLWLARDLRRARYVAVKAITADASAYTPELV
ncbi:kinase-like protein [Penicillium alfredii]|uniref:non-specific serine/threonine protein kinase n=1 Tax=Penicillium alfredii TaxID=1506179 RepID=A0A9W9EMT3_9EURO|nr:kinase-like protein [Penicillium alfredii]KAJ5084579.1 kinase-like protein [Penicillium alfredii]